MSQLLTWMVESVLLAWSVWIQMPTAVLADMPAPAKLRLFRMMPAVWLISMPEPLALLIVARLVPPKMPNVMGLALVPPSVDGIAIVPLNAWPEANRIVSPGLSVWLLSRVIDFHGLVAE